MFLHRLALRMGRTLGELGATLTTDELAQWMAFDARSPLGDERRDLLFARLCLLVAQVAGAKKGRVKPPGPNDFSIEDFLMWKPKAKPVSPIAFMRARFSPRIQKGKRKKAHGAG